MPVSPSQGAESNHLTTFTVKANGVPLEPRHGIVSIEIRREVNRVPKATLVFNDGDSAAQNFPLSEEDTLIPGVAIEVLGGYSSVESILFKGILTRHRIEVGERGGSRLVIEARDPAFRMTLGPRSRNFGDVTDADVLEQLIVSTPGLRAEVAATSLVHPQIVQHQVSDWDFLVMRAEQAGLAVVCVDGTVRVGAPAVAGQASAAAVFGEGLRAAELELDAESQLVAVEAGGWDPADQALLTSRADDASTPGPGDIDGADLARAGGASAALRHPGALDQALLDQWTAAAMGRVRRAAVRGRLKLQGAAELLPGVLIDLGGLGRRFNGTGYVSGVRHRLGRGDWTTDLLIGSDPRLHVERYAVAAPAAAGAVAPVPGLQIGIVAALEGDPAGEERLQVRLPTITETDGLVWARQALPDAGQDRGTSFRPEIGDEVVVGFLDGDPRHPVVLGALHSSARAAPLPGADANHEKAIVTRSGMRIHWDDEAVVATIDTPAGNRIVLSEADRAVVVTDQHGNKMTLDAAGIALESGSDISVKASGDVRIEGTNVEFSARASLRGRGGAGAELTSDGSTTVRGSLVQIN